VSLSLARRGIKVFAWMPVRDDLPALCRDLAAHAHLDGIVLRGDDAAAGRPDDLRKILFRHRGKVALARALDADAALDPAGSYARSLEAYDFVVLLADPRSEGVGDAGAWLRALVREAKRREGGLGKTVFGIQIRDPARGAWVDSRQVQSWLRVLLIEGAHHVGYYPDSHADGMPDEEIVSGPISTRDVPFER
jgi:hypothetical protein